MISPYRCKCSSHLNHPLTYMVVFHISSCVSQIPVMGSVSSRDSNQILLCPDRLCLVDIPCNSDCLSHRLWDTRMLFCKLMRRERRHFIWGLWIHFVCLETGPSLEQHSRILVFLSLDQHSLILVFLILASSHLDLCLILAQSKLSSIKVCNKYCKSTHISISLGFKMWES